MGKWIKDLEELAFYNLDIVEKISVYKRDGRYLIKLYRQNNYCPYEIEGFIDKSSALKYLNDVLENDYR